MTLNDTFERRSLFQTRVHAWDDVLAVEGHRVDLRSGSVTVEPSLAAQAHQVLAGVRVTGVPTTDAAEFSRYLSGPWAPLRAASALLDIATKANASDVHLEPGLEHVDVRLRRMGELTTFTTLTQPLARRLTAALKSLAGCLPYRFDLVQEGRIPRPGVTADVRASFVPTALGERIALRLFGRLLSLDALELPADVRTRFEHALTQSASGLIIVAGPSGGGKTTTLYAALAHLAKHRHGAHLSLEDPVEQRLRVAGVPVDQVELSPERGLTGEAALVAALRQDVDVLAVGEVRTGGEATLALRAAHTGRLVLAGLHAGSANEARQRLLDLGLEQPLLDQTLVAVLHQRLETRACEDASPTCPRCSGLGRTRVAAGTLWLRAAGLQEVA
ncbi:MAG: Flp pilus assembly complex ATPase component TadA [Archangium sp.]|nr:Flp pilus assembly complex ATPase component TadA [Archangium sp.]